MLGSATSQRGGGKETSGRGTYTTPKQYIFLCIHILYNQYLYIYDIFILYHLHVIAKGNREGEAKARKGRRKVGCHVACIGIEGPTASVTTTTTTRGYSLFNTDFKYKLYSTSQKEFLGRHVYIYNTKAV